EMAAVQQDEAKFIDRATMGLIITDDYVIQDGPVKPGMAKRKTIFDLETELKALRVPTLIMVGDRDAPCVEPSLLMRSWIPHAGLVVFPACGHTPNLEEPGLFNLLVSEFLVAVEGGRWAGLSR
ncbi:MAG: hypothetical protein P8Y76_11930, partial [bacterium]